MIYAKQHAFIFLMLVLGLLFSACMPEDIEIVNNNLQNDLSLSPILDSTDDHTRADLSLALLPDDLNFHEMCHVQNLRELFAGPVRYDFDEYVTWNWNNDDMDDSNVLLYGGVFYHDGQTVFLKSDGVYLSEDAGITMQQILNIPSVQNHTYYQRVVYSYQDDIYILEEDGIYRSDFRGAEPQRISNITPQIVSKEIYQSTFPEVIDWYWEVRGVTFLEDKLFFIVQDGSGHPGQYYIMDLKSTKLQELTFPTLHTGTYCITLTYLYADSYSDSIYQVDIDSLNTVAILKPDSESLINISYIYKDLLFFTSSSRNAIYTYNTQSQISTALYNAKENDSLQVFQICPQGILFYSNIENNNYSKSDICLYEFSSGEVVQLIPRSENEKYEKIYVAGDCIYGYNSDYKNDFANELYDLLYSF